MNSFGTLFFLSFSMLALSVGPTIGAETGTSVDSRNNIQFIFDDVPSLKVAASKAAPAGSACASPIDPKTNTPIYEGAMRYNSTIDDIEFCNGTIWEGMSQPYPSGYAVSVDYTKCTDAITSHSNTNLYKYYKAFGGAEFQINIACPKDYVMVASDASARTNTDTYTDAFCCKLIVK